ncbi:NUDIX hydrolase [Pseudonocardia petroleophila]|uniref:NUDIX domain-containing protein n=1 Tax=Pseudonocardia petroleophila TaxID=37331 RepID=A0A7G7MLJ0_9PSEU|nr:NUDIX domain-containing protein [Pseudonocardia petroleophila]QNG53651.1 NUDIX domain-containing protein [Pseudonocardia petroleophila]
MTGAEQRQRVGAYVVCVREGSLLLVRFTGSRRWALPGGGLDHGEDPRDAAVREVAEETGLDVALGPLLDVGSRVWDDRGHRLHMISILFSGEITGGTLRHEVGGSSDHAAWVPLADVEGLDRSRMIDVGLAAAGIGAAGIRPGAPPR